MEETEIAWAAGFFDGEGGMSWGTGWKKRYPMLHITQTDARPLERFVKAVGFGKVVGPRKGYREDCRKRYDIRITKNEHVGAVVMILWKYLSEPKREQINKVLEFCRTSEASVSDKRREANKVRCKLYSQAVFSIK